MADTSIIGQTTVIRGNVRGEGAIEILGRVEGDVTTDGDVALGDQAAVMGSVTGAALRIGGEVSGDLRGSEAVVLTETARVNGDLRAPRIGIAEGAQLRGNVQTGASGATSAPRATARAQQEPERARPAAPARPARPAPAPAPAKQPARKPPPPVVPAVSKGSRARKKKARRR